MSSSSLVLVASALLPALCTVGFGGLAAGRGHFTLDDASAINRLVLLYTLPLGLCAGMLHTPQSVLLGLGPGAAWLALALVLSGLVPWLVLRWWLRLSPTVSTLLSLLVGMPSVMFLGTPVLGPLTGSASTSLIVVSGFVQNLVLLPLSMVSMSLTHGQGGTAKALRRSVGQALGQPLVWAPLLGAVIVAAGLQAPAMVIDIGHLLGVATGGLALFATGLVLRAGPLVLSWLTIGPVVARNLVVPGVCYLALMFMKADPETTRQIVLTMALPTGSIVLILATQVGQLEREVASAVALSTLASPLSMGLFIVLTA